MEPIPESVEVAQLLELHDPDLDILDYLQDLAQRVRQIAPGCIGMSVAWLRQGVAFTLIASDEEIAALDAVQYLDGGPCVDAVDEGRGLAVNERSLLDEDRWHLFARTAAGHGVATSLSFPLTQDGTVTGSVNLYGASPETFDGHHEVLADVVGEHATTIVTNADLSFSTREAAERSPEDLRSQVVVSQAVGMLMGEMDIDAETALARLSRAAARARVGVEDLARALVNDPGSH